LNNLAGHGNIPINQPNIHRYFTSDKSFIKKYQPHLQPMTSNYTRLEDRIESFKHWPLSFQDPENLSKAGFFYTGDIFPIFFFSSR